MFGGKSFKVFLPAGNSFFCSLDFAGSEFMYAFKMSFLFFDEFTLFLNLDKAVPFIFFKLQL